MKHPPALHLYVNTRLGCGKKVAYTRFGADTRFTGEIDKASCHRCAKNAVGITERSDDSSRNV